MRLQDDCAILGRAILGRTLGNPSKNLMFRNYSDVFAVIAYIHLEDVRMQPYFSMAALIEKVYADKMWGIHRKQELYRVR